MRVEKLFWIVVSMVILSYIFVIQPTQSNDIWTSDEYESKIEANNINVDREKTVTYVYNSKEDLKKANTIMIIRRHVELRISVDGETMVEIKPNPNSVVKTTGKGWTMFKLKDEYLNKNIDIEITPIHDNIGSVIIYKGDSRTILSDLFIKDIVETLINCILVFMSTALMLIAASDIVSKGSKQGLYYLGAMALAVAGWRMGEINTLRLILPYDVGWSNLSYICLSFMPLTFALYFRTGITCKWRNIINVFCIVNAGGIILQLILQLTSYADYTQSVQITHVIIASLNIIVVGVYIDERKNKEHIKFLRSSQMLFLTMAAISLISLMIYKVTGVNSNTIALVLVFYIMVLAFNKINDIRKQSLKNDKVDVYKQLAFVDEMTGLYNRTALEHDLRLYNRRKIETLAGLDPFTNLVVIIIDLNDLKVCNDKHGHEYGDMYIKDVAKVINDIFVENSKCYRMGGDEFCVIVKEAISININKRISELKYEVDLLNDVDNVFVYKMAIGYAQYNSDVDYLMEDILKRADENMYAHKRFIKYVDKNPKDSKYDKA